MDDAPNPLINFNDYKEYDYIIDNKEYKVKIVNKYKNIVISVSEINNISSFFQNSFSLQKLIQINNYFRMFDTIIDAMENICKLFEENNYNLIIKNNIIKILLLPGFSIKGRIELELKPETKNESQQIKDLMSVTQSLINRVTLLENNNKTLKEEISTLKYQIKNLTEKKEYFQKPLNNFFSDSFIIKTNEAKNRMLKFLNDDTIKYTVLIYRGTRDGDNAYNFHQKCDGKAPTLTLIRALKNQIFGGYTEAAWDSLSRHSKSDENAFIFSITNNIKLKTKNKDESIECNSDYGPVFGFGGDLTIVNKFLIYASNMWTECKTYKDFTCSITNGYRNFNVEELEVYLIVN